MYIEARTFNEGVPVKINPFCISEFEEGDNPERIDITLLNCSFKGVSIRGYVDDLAEFLMCWSLDLEVKEYHFFQPSNI